MIDEILPKPTWNEPRCPNPNCGQTIFHTVLYNLVEPRHQVRLITCTACGTAIGVPEDDILRRLSAIEKKLGIT